MLREGVEVTIVAAIQESGAQLLIEVHNVVLAFFHQNITKNLNMRISLVVVLVSLYGLSFPNALSPLQFLLTTKNIAR